MAQPSPESIFDTLTAYQRRRLHFPEYDRMFRNAGFGRSEGHTIPPVEQQVIVSWK
ncbi:MAG: hypothetical protein HYR60_19795 [Acidobacteria bacterium]|nr:hypothetical protein [Acidobacteriota bacterium]MBI3473200.1 hypothetical protein [Candidatus Solibacter usitatus]